MNTPAQKLLAMLEDEVESLPADEVRGDLASLGIDPSGAVAFAHALAGSTGSPGGQLLGAIAAAEEAEAEIARIEAADIGDVRAQIPEGTAAAIAAEARRTADADGNVVGIGARRRGRVLRWGGPLAGIAASLVLVFVVGQVYLLNEREFSREVALESELKTAERVDRAPEPAPAADAVMEDRVAGLPLVEARKAPVGSMERSFGGAGGAGGAGGDGPSLAAPDQAPEKARGELAYKSLGDADDSRDKSAAVAPEAEPESTIGLMAKQEGRRAAPAAPPAASAPMPAEAFSADTAGEKKFDGGAVVAAKPAPAAGLFSSEEMTETDTLARARADAPRIAAVFLVDRRQAPVSMQNQALPAGGLAGRLDEARMLAGDRPVIALYTVESSAGRQDYAQVPLMPAMSQQMPAPIPVVGLLGAEAAQFDFIALP